MKKDTKMLILAGLYIFCLLGGATTYVGVYAYFPEYVGVSLVDFSFGPSIYYAVVAILSILGAGIVIKKWGPKMCMLLGCCALLTYSLILGLAPARSTLYLAFGLSGIISSIAGLACVSDLLIRWGRASSISFILGCSFVGNGFWQSLSTIVMTRLGMRYVWLINTLAASVIGLICVLLIDDRQKEMREQIAKEVEEKKAGQASANRTNILKNPAVYVLFLAVFLMPFMTQGPVSYATKYYPSFGKISVEASGTLVGAMGILLGIYNMFFAKRVIEKVNPKVYAALVVGCEALTSVFAFLYARVPQFWVIILMMLVYSIGGTVMNLGTVLNPMLFGTEAATDVTAKMLGFAYLGGSVFGPVVASIVTDYGFDMLWGLAVISAFVVYGLFFLAFTIAGKRGTSVSE